MISGRFIRRVNRFIAEVLIDGKEEKVHIKNTGRLRELLRPDATVLLEVSDNPNRKTKYSLISVEKEGRLVNIDSQVPNTVVYEALQAGKIPQFPKFHTLKREVTYGNSRFDLYFETEHKKGFIEVKGVTLENQGIAKFPDAPTTRGTKHILELIKATEEGYKGVIFFVIQMKGCHLFQPNQQMDQFFSEALKEAANKGVQILAYDSIVNDSEIVIDQQIPIELL